MRALVLPGPGQPLVLEDIPLPEPRSNEVLVRVIACGICHTDLHVIKGEVRFPTPAVLGHEISGRIVQRGPDLEWPPIGASVVASFIMPCGTCGSCARGRDDLCEPFFAMNRQQGTLLDGSTRLARNDGTPLAMYSMAGLAEYAVVPASDIFPLPVGLPEIESAVLGCAVFTAFGAVQHAARLRGGERVAVVATGGVGLNIVQLSKAFGAAEIIAVDVSAEKLEIATALGATTTVNAAEEDAVARVREVTGGAGVDVAFEALGRAETFVQAFEMLRDGGRMVAVGIASGRTTAPIEITPLVRRGLRVVGSYGARVRSDMPVILALAQAGHLRPERMVTRRVALQDVGTAYQDLDEGRIIGRAVAVL